MDREQQRSDKGRDEASPKKKPYHRPEILYRQPIEAVAVVCGPPDGKSNPGMCPMQVQS